jgi:hypothetical protein
MNVLTSILVYTITILFTPLVLLFYREFARALLTFILSILLITLPISIVIGVITVRGHRKPQ